MKSEINRRTALLQQALKLKTSPPLSTVRRLVEKLRAYQRETGRMIIYAAHGKRVELIDRQALFEALGDIVGIKQTIRSFQDIADILGTQTRTQLVRHTGDTKLKHLSPFAQTLLIRHGAAPPRLYKAEEMASHLHDIDHIVAVENAETFLDFGAYMHRFKSEVCVYLGGNPNRTTAQFIADKKVCFFIDFDIVSMNFFERVVCADKSLYIPENIEALFEAYGNKHLYAKQLPLLQTHYTTSQASRIIALIKRYRCVLEQEALAP